MSMMSWDFEGLDFFSNICFRLVDEILFFLFFHLQDPTIKKTCYQFSFNQLFKTNKFVCTDQIEIR